MNAIVKSIIPGSPASRSSITPGDILRRINGSVIGDVLDYKYHSYDSRVLLELLTASGKLKLVKFRKPEGADIGLEFESFLMDKERSCANKCIFCFIDQLPAGMRESLYYKDDDVRLSFLQGNYITLTNLSRKDIERIIELRISPINVSVHTLDPELRAFMLGSKGGCAGVGTLKALAGAGITLNCQIVCCPGINDGTELSKTIEGFIALGHSINSVSVVPVGLTKHRRGLPELRAFDRELALQTVKQVEIYGEKCLVKRGSGVFFCADELYMTAGLELPSHEFYEDYPQLENGVGMMRLFIKEFEVAAGRKELQTVHSQNVIKTPGLSIATGKLAYPYLTKLSRIVAEKYGIISEVYGISNNFFGDSVTVSGLITGRDLIDQLSGRELGEKLLFPRNMLRHGEDVFLDDVTTADVSKALGVEVIAVDQNGADLLRAMIWKQE